MQAIDPRLKTSRNANQFMSSPGRQFDTTSEGRRKKQAKGWEIKGSGRQKHERANS